MSVLGSVIGRLHIENDEAEEHSEESDSKSTPVLETRVPTRKRKQDNSEGETKKTRAKKKDKITMSSAVEGEVSYSPKADGSPNAASDSSPPDLPNDLEKNEPTTKKANKRRKVDNPSDGSAGKSTATKLSKKDQAIQEFMLDILPALKKNLKQKKTHNQSFKIRNHGDYFASNSTYIPTYLLSLFHFLGTEEIVCTRYGNFDGKHMVKTTCGFNHASMLINHCDSLGESEVTYLMKKFGKEWFKIPSKDGVKAASANRYGDMGAFKIILIGLYEDSFMNSVGEEVLTINPILRYEPIKPKKKE
jgi:hypothetical protein